MTNDLLLAILSLDAYNQGYDEALEHGETQIGTATRALESDIERDSSAVQASFYAVEYSTPLGTVIAYRGTDDPNLFGPLWSDDEASDAWDGWVEGAGVPLSTQAELAAEFFQTVTGTETSDPQQGEAIVTGHSLGGVLEHVRFTLHHTLLQRSSWRTRLV